jgi:GT2 family glycosyltransferase
MLCAAEAMSQALSFVIPTRNRHDRLVKTLRSLTNQNFRPEQVIVVDASDNFSEFDQLSREFSGCFEHFLIFRAAVCGAAIQRNEGVIRAYGGLIGFCDDDIDFEPECIARLRNFLADKPPYLGVAATVTNQAPRQIGRLTKSVLKLIDNNRDEPCDGRVVGPGINLYPIFDPEGPLFRQTEWLNLGATIYRKNSLPAPPFDNAIRGFSIAEDVALSCRVAMKGPLAVLRDARIFHDSQPGDHKSDKSVVARLMVRNRFHIATEVLHRPALTSWSQLVLWELFSAIASIKRVSLCSCIRQGVGAFHGFVDIVLKKN